MSPDRAAGGKTADGSGRACLGLGLAGYGLAVLSGVMPHEEPLVGAGLLAFGGVLVATGTLPAVSGLRRWHLLLSGAAAFAAVGAGWAVTGRAPAGPMLLLALLGASLLAASALPARSVRVGRHALALPDLGPSAAAAIGAPLLVWMAQAAFKRWSGASPLEAFEVVLLVTPVHWALGLLGLPSAMDGQVLTTSGPDGPLAVQVGVACSGLQAMALFLGILALFAAAERPTGRRLATWTVVGLGGVYVANLLRLVAVVLAGHAWGPAALQEVHANAGWAFFAAWALLFAVWVRRGLARGSGGPAARLPSS